MAVAMMLATAVVARTALGYRPFPSVDDFTYIPLGLAGLDPELFVRDDILNAALNRTPFWPWIIHVLRSTIGLADGMFLLTLMMTLLTVLAVSRLLRSLRGSYLFLPLAIALSITVNVPGIGRGAMEGVLGDAFHMQWVALVLVLGAFAAFVQKQPVKAGLLLGVTAWVHPLVAAHGAFTLTIAGLANRTRGLVDTVQTGLVAFLISLPASVSLVRAMVGRGGGVTGVSQSRLIQDTVLFRTPHHYDLGILPFLMAAVLGLAALAALPRLMARPGVETRRYYGLLLGQGTLLFATFLFHGPYLFRGNPPWPFFLYTLDLSRTTPLFFILSGVAVAAALPRADEPLVADKHRRTVDRVFAFSTMLSVGFLLLVNLLPTPWVPVLLLLAAMAYAGARMGIGVRPMTAFLLAFAGVGFVSFMRGVEVAAPFDSLDEGLFTWARTQTAKDGLFIIPPSLEAFRLGAQRSAYVDFKLIPPGHPSLAWRARTRLEEVTNPDAKALEQARGWPGLYWWDVSYAKRNPPERIARLLASTGADYFVQDRVYLELPPHLDSDEDQHPEAAGLEVAFENPRFRVFRRAGRP